MGTATRGKFSHLVRQLQDNPSAYRLFQALQLLESHLGGEALIGEEMHRFISLAPASELSFPAGEIRHCDLDTKDRYRLEVNLMGFFGVDSPLPQFFNDLAARETAGSAELRAFLELFNQRLYQLLYSAWKKMNLHGSDRQRTSLYCRYLESLYGGSGTCHLLGRFDYAGMMGNRVRNGQSLGDMLEDFLGCPAQVQQNIPCWIVLEEPVSLGEGMALGENALLGNRLMDVNSKIRIEIGPVPMGKAVHLLPGGKQSRTLASLIREYLDPTLQYELVMILQPEEAFQSSLGNDSSILGWTTCMGHASGAVSRICLPGESLDRQRADTTTDPIRQSALAA